MTAWPSSPIWISPEEYLEREAEASFRHEYVGGEIFAMAGASRRHNRLILNAVRALDPGLAGGPCEVHVEGVKLRIALLSGTAYYYPDAMVACDPEDEHAHFVERPALLIEVLSPETKRIDRIEKLTAYESIPSLQQYWLVEQERMGVCVWRRAGAEWLEEMFSEPGQTIETPWPGVKVRLEDLYARIVF